MSGRILIDTSNLNTIMASAKPTESQASKDAATKLLEALDKNYLPEQGDKAINNAFKAFFKTRGLNLPCRLLDYFITSGDRNLARQYLVALECVYLLKKLPETRACAIKPRLHQFLQSIGILEKSQGLQKLLFEDQLLRSPQSPSLVGLIFSQLFSLSKNPVAMVDYCEVSDFKIMANQPWEHSFINQKGENVTRTEFPAAGHICINDKDLPFDGNYFKFYSASTTENIFCQHFLLSRGLGETAKENSAFISSINKSKSDLTKALSKYERQESDLSKSLSETGNRKRLIKELFSTNCNSDQLPDELRGYASFMEELSDNCRALKDDWDAGWDCALKFADFDPRIENDGVNCKSVIKVAVGTNHDVEFIYTDERPDVQVLEQDSGYFSTIFWDRQIKSDLYKHASGSIELYSKLARECGDKVDELLKHISEYHAETANYNTHATEYIKDFEAAQRRQGLLHTAKELLDGVIHAHPAKEPLLTRSPTREQRSVNSRGNSPAPSSSINTHQSSDHNQRSEVIKDDIEKINAIKGWINQCISVQQAISGTKNHLDGINTALKKIETLRNQLNNEMKLFLQLENADPINIQGFNYDKNTKALQEKDTEINSILENMVNGQSIITKQFLEDCEKEEDTDKRLEMIDRVARYTQPRPSVNANTDINAAMSAFL